MGTAPVPRAFLAAGHGNRGGLLGCSCCGRWTAPCCITARPAWYRQVMATPGDDDYSLELWLSREYGRLVDGLAELFDAEASRVRFFAWLDAHTEKKPADPGSPPEGT